MDLERYFYPELSLLLLSGPTLSIDLVLVPQLSTCQDVPTRLLNFSYQSLVLWDYTEIKDSLQRGSQGPRWSSSPLCRTASSSHSRTSSTAFQPHSSTLSSPSVPNLLSSQAIASAQDTLPRALPSFTFLLGRHLLLGNFAVPTRLDWVLLLCGSPPCSASPDHRGPLVDVALPVYFQVFLPRSESRSCVFFKLHPQSLAECWKLVGN